MFDFEAKKEKPQRRRPREIWALDREGREALAATIGPRVREELGLPAGSYRSDDCEDSEEGR